MSRRKRPLILPGTLFQVNRVSLDDLLFLAIGQGHVEIDKSHGDVREEKPDELRSNVLRPEGTFGATDTFRAERRGNQTKGAIETTDEQSGQGTARGFQT